MRADWKNVARRVAAMHNQFGGGGVTIGPTNGRRTMMNLSGSDEWEGVGRRELHPREIREFLWRRRRMKVMKSPWVSVWTASEVATSYMGVGVLVRERGAVRAIKMGRICIDLEQTDGE